MTTVRLPSPRYRRILLLCAASVALHYLAIDWVGEHIGPLHAAARPATPAVITAQLHLALPAPPPAAAAAPLPEIKPLARRTQRPPRPPAVPAPSPVPADDAAPGPDPAAQEPPVAEAAAPAMPSAPPAATPAPAPEPAATPQPAPPEPPVGPRRYKVNLPAPAEFAMEVHRVDANGTTWSGVTAMSWRHDGSHYALSVEAGISMLITRVNLLVLTSAGEIDDNGIAPVTATEKRRGRAQTATHFNREQGSITFSASEQAYPLLAGSQDKATLPFQLAGIGRADPNQFAGNIDILVGEDTEANVFRFLLVGEEELDTRLGKLATWHLSRPPKPGTYSSRLDIWLAPGLGWYPVQIRNTEGSGALTTQTVSSITLTEPKGK